MPSYADACDAKVGPAADASTSVVPVLAARRLADDEAEQRMRHQKDHLYRRPVVAGEPRLH